MDERELRDIRRRAEREHLTVAEWVRRAIHEAARQAPAVDPDRKLRVVRAAVKHAFPTADLGAMLEEIERGYGGET